MLGAGSLVPAGGAEVLEAEAHGGLLFDDNTLHPVDVPGEAVRGHAAGDKEGVEEGVRHYVKNNFLQQNEFFVGRLVMELPLQWCARVPRHQPPL